MLSPDELKDGMTFILQLDATAIRAGRARESVQWVETLRGDAARRWYDIYRTSDWDALRAEAGDVFHCRVDAAELQQLRKQRRRCVFIHTPAVTADELVGGAGGASVVGLILEKTPGESEQLQ
jgi:hypothetical protein